MSDRTPEQVNSALDRSEQILAEQAQRMDNVTLALDRLTGLVEQIGERTNARLTQHDRELDEQDVRTERLEQNHLEHADRMAKLEDIQADVKVMLEILLRRSIGETGETNG
jgi:hypothetical protein